MLISVKHDFVVFCTPKCASNSIERMLQEYSDISISGPPYFRHTNFRGYSTYIEPYLKEMTGKDTFDTICLFREPVSWLSSHYRFRSRLELRNPKSPRFSASTYGIKFSEYVEAFMSPDPPPYAAMQSQFNFVKNDMNEAGVARIFLHENLAEFVRYMSQKIGKPLKLGRQNVSPKSGNETRLAELTDYAKRKIASRLNLKRSDTAEVARYEISDQQLTSLRTFLAEDFALYERLKSADNAA